MDYRDMFRLLLTARKDDDIDKEIKKSLELYKSQIIPASSLIFVEVSFAVLRGMVFISKRGRNLALCKNLPIRMPR